MFAGKIDRQSLKRFLKCFTKFSHSLNYYVIEPELNLPIESYLTYVFLLKSPVPYVLNILNKDLDTVYFW